LTAASAPTKTFDNAVDGIDTPHGFALRPNTKELWLTNRPAVNLVDTTQGHGFVIRFDIDTKTVITAPTAKLETTATSGDQPNNIAFIEDGSLAYVVNTGATPSGTATTPALQVTIVNAATFVVKKQINQDAVKGRSPHAITFDPVAKRMYVANSVGATVSVIDTVNEAVIAYMDTGTQTHGVFLTPDSKYLYVPIRNPESAMFEFDTATLRLQAIVGSGSLFGPHWLVFE
jgi:YVTN family beta-propeller protein